MSAIRTGDLVEVAAQRLLERDGWAVHRTRRAKFQQNDVFGCFDLIAVSSGDGWTLFVQTTTKTNQGARRRKVAAWARPIFDAARWADRGPVIQVWAWGKWAKGTGFRIWTYLGGTEWSTVDAVRPAPLTEA